ncbi:chorismate lyase [Castellaniella daejeonensis]|jgi:chorismate--pyruvate lyase|uniref:Probable chorismate pyruvate-lyase n=1 Tax=Castellaniella daejeonensis TaxID=659013 RepID=A0ABN0TDZ4_9BURK|nr:chorismate lyase [Castellaniella sp.]HET8702799.1 chorismate lyase [Castellaniella sp.]
MTPDTALPRPWRDAPAPGLGRVRQVWLQRPGALTAGLRRLGEVRLTVRREAVEALTPGWAAEAGLPAGTPVWWREILMTIDRVPAVQACSFTPLRASLGAWKAMRGLGQRPLADILYRDPRILRSGFRFGRLQVRRADGTWEYTGAGETVLARHSVFLRLGQPLLVAEYFLPSFWTLAGR